MRSVPPQVRGDFRLKGNTSYAWWAKSVAKRKKYRTLWTEAKAFGPTKTAILPSWRGRYVPRSAFGPLEAGQ
jgi:hypothetical protein